MSEKSRKSLLAAIQSAMLRCVIYRFAVKKQNLCHPLEMTKGNFWFGLNYN
jgi:hypothetical protein